MSGHAYMDPEVQALLRESARPAQLVPTIITFQESVVHIGARVTACTTVPFRFRPFALRIHHDTAHMVFVRSITAGKHILLHGEGAVPGEAFCERRRKLTLPLNWGCLEAGEQVAVTLANPGASGALYVAMYLVGAEER